MKLDLQSNRRRRHQIEAPKEFFESNIRADSSTRPTWDSSLTAASRRPHETKAEVRGGGRNRILKGTGQAAGFD